MSRQSFRLIVKKFAIKNYYLILGLIVMSIHQRPLTFIDIFHRISHNVNKCYLFIFIFSVAYDSIFARL